MKLESNPFAIDEEDTGEEGGDGVGGASTVVAVYSAFQREVGDWRFPGMDGAWWVRGRGWEGKGRDRGGLMETHVGARSRRRGVAMLVLR